MLNLQTERLRFEQYTLEDVEVVTALVTDARVMQFIGDGNVKDQAYAKHLIERMLEQYRNFGDYGLHKLIHKETGEFIGHAGLVAQIIDDAFEMELGYWIAPAYWQQGYGFEAARALKGYADEEMYLERYVSAIQVGNTGSKQIALKNGMKLEKVITMEGKSVEIYVLENEIE
ncbi:MULTISPECIES: GNAT family N-acetyltransferase [Solibacillus]|uniref:GNAT family N-acetyltransferase n=1 Tax=Solibacillus merdavium TaxID=2762218 RepID=A0ABR8XLL2_9BACL|nr:GNAT family N-acetyltransferase [Solibacillus merdavium]MBD8032812.1 GNAT family N-acetyltransferase [Solibacillus merdavium]